MQNLKNLKVSAHFRLKLKPLILAFVSYRSLVCIVQIFGFQTGEGEGEVLKEVRSSVTSFLIFGLGRPTPAFCP
jgi:hypothetical protein